MARAAERFPLTRTLLRDGALVVETPLPDAAPSAQNAALAQEAALVARTLIQFDGDIVTKVRPGADPALVAAHFAAVDRQSTALASEFRTLCRRLAWLLRGLLAGRVCLAGGSGLSLASGGALLWGEHSATVAGWLNLAGPWLWTPVVAAAVGAGTEAARKTLLRRFRSALGL
ncbi:MAG: hypothetical protein KDC18_06400 [Alphaproteobacteria bacterium]|nr:hypothetical protein [Alphaproteobacteria bacterium]MCB9931626.1 hypothetical protein [Alphaproteobacteria bacterium]